MKPILKSLRRKSLLCALLVSLTALSLHAQAAATPLPSDIASGTLVDAPFNGLALVKSFGDAVLVLTEHMDIHEGYRKARDLFDVNLGTTQASDAAQHFFDTLFGAEGTVTHTQAEAGFHIIATAALTLGICLILFAAGYVYQTYKVGRNLRDTIAERDQSLLELDRYLKQTSELTNNLTTMISFDGCFKRLNSSWEKTLGYSIEEMLDKPFIDFIHPDDHERSLAAAADLVENGSLHAFENRYRCKDGSYRVLEWSAQSYHDGEYLFAIATDITDRKLAHETLKQSEENLRVITQSSPVSIVIARVSDSTILFANPQAGDFFAMEPADMVGRQTYELYQNPEDRALLISLLKKVGRVRNLELWLKRSDGTTFLGMASFETLQYKGEDAIMSAIMDVTAQHDTQEQLVQAAKLATLGEMASGITHELNQPLSIVRMAAEAAEMELHDSTPNMELMEKKLLTVIEQSDRMGSIINHMRQFSRKDTGPLETFSPLRPVKAAAALLEHQLKTADIRLETNFPSICRNLYGQAVRLEQVVLNLLANAKDSVCEKKAQLADGTLEYKAHIRIDVEDQPEKGVINIRISDNGTGLPQTDAGTIFDPFFTTKKQGEGTGLGLSISYSIINAMGGSIEARNQDKGAVFEISIPVNGPDQAQDTRAELALSAANNVQDNYNSGVRSVLIVDDEILAAESIAEYLERNGCVVHIANNGAEALDIFHAHPTTDAVITDLRMPVMDGNELIRLLRKENQNLPIIVTTGHTMIGDDEEIIAEGATLVLKKPVRLREVLTELENACNK